MDHFEKKYVSFPSRTLGFIDDLFFKGTSTKEQLENCLNNLNKKHNSIKLEYKISQTTITFLDTEIFI